MFKHLHVQFDFILTKDLITAKFKMVCFYQSGKLIQSQSSHVRLKSVTITQHVVVPLSVVFIKSL